VPWLRGHVAELIGSFAAAADFDPSRLMEQFGGMGLDPQALSDPSSLQEALTKGEGLAIEPTAGQKAALSKVQALVAFVEGYADVVVRAAAAERLTSLPRIEEATRRRRASKGPGEQFLAQLIGLDLKPADFRLGQAFCESAITARGQEGLDRVWEAPECLPDEHELGDPSRWLVRMAAREIERGLEAGGASSDDHG
jgi:putative hydrolase